MSKTYRPYHPEQLFLLPPSLKDWLPKDHLVYFIDEVFDELDLSAIEQVYEREERGYPPYNPRMMAKILFYAQCVGVRSSRKIACRLVEDVAFRVLGAGNFPKFRAICEFRSRHLKALSGLFAQVLLMCDRAELIGMKHVALDGTKIKANASKHKAMSYGRMKEAELRLQKELEQYLRENQAIDEREDRKFGPDRQGDELPPELADREKRLARIREAKAALEAEARQREQEQEADYDSAANHAVGNEDSKHHRKNRARRLRKHPPGTPKDKAQYNFTDPESRIMLNSDKAFIQAYNAQAAVDSKNQIIVAAELTNRAQDGTHLPQVVKAVEANLNRKPYGFSADAGYFSDTNLTCLKDEVIAAYIPPDKQKHNAAQICAPRGRMPKDISHADRMRRKLQTKRGKAEYVLRKQTVEPVFGQIKEARGLRQFLLRGVVKARAEWLMACTAHNLLKLWRATNGFSFGDQQLRKTAQRICLLSLAHPYPQNLPIFKVQ